MSFCYECLLLYQSNKKKTWSINWKNVIYDWEPPKKPWMSHVYSRKIFKSFSLSYITMIIILVYQPIFLFCFSSTCEYKQRKILFHVYKVIRTNIICICCFYISFSDLQGRKVPKQTSPKGRTTRQWKFYRVFSSSSLYTIG